MNLAVFYTTKPQCSEQWNKKKINRNSTARNFQLKKFYEYSKITRDLFAKITDCKCFDGSGGLNEIKRIPVQQFQILISNGSQE